MRLDELFDRTVPYHWTIKRPDLWQAEFETDGVKYIIAATVDNDYVKERGGEKFSNCDLSFGLESDGFSGTKVVGTNKQEFKIFATVLTAFKEYITTMKPDYISINASKENNNRFRVYSKIAERLAPEIAKLGYKRGDCLINSYIDTTKYFDAICLVKD